MALPSFSGEGTVAAPPEIIDHSGGPIVNLTVRFEPARGEVLTTQIACYGEQARTARTLRPGDPVVVHGWLRGTRRVDHRTCPQFVAAALGRMGQTGEKTPA